MDDVEAIAAGLTEGQRYAVRHMGGPYPRGAPHMTPDELAELDDLFWTAPPRAMLPLGLRVREVLERKR